MNILKYIEMIWHDNMYATVDVQVYASVLNGIGSAWFNCVAKAPLTKQPFTVRISRRRTTMTTHALAPGHGFDMVRLLTGLGFWQDFFQLTIFVHLHHLSPNSFNCNHSKNPRISWGSRPRRCHNHPRTLHSWAFCATIVEVEPTDKMPGKPWKTQAGSLELLLLWLDYSLQHPSTNFHELKIAEVRI